jgi:hypothetical protein
VARSTHAQELQNAAFIFHPPLGTQHRHRPMGTAHYYIKRRKKAACSKAELLLATSGCSRLRVI